MADDDDQSDSGTLLDIELDGRRRSIWCWQYLASYTYANFQIRSSSESCNQAMLEGVRSEARRVFGDWPVHIVEPIRPAGTIDYPRVRFTGFFTSLPMDDQMHLSSLVVVWFQPTQWPAVDDHTLARIRSLAWETLALDYET